MKQRQKKAGLLAGLFFLLLLLMTLTTAAMGASASAVVIETTQDLLDFAASVSAGQTYAGQTVTLARDLDMTGQSFTAIGRVGGDGDRSRVFQGTFDGGGHYITGLTAAPNPQSTGYVGMFSALQDAIVQDLALEITINGQGYTALGGLAAVAEESYIMDVTVYIQASASQFLPSESGMATVGGLVGRASGELYIDRCGVQGSINTVSTPGVQLYLGGLAGRLEPLAGSYVSNCYSTAFLSATGLEAYVGGLAGGLYGSEPVVENCYSAAFIKARGDHVGAFMGHCDKGQGLLNLYYDSDLAAAQLLPGVAGGEIGGLTGVSSDTLRSTEFLPQLGGAFMAAGSMDVNLGYPILYRWPTPTPEPTAVPTPEPTEAPTPEPTEAPTPEPTEVPTPEPTEVPTPEPTEVPTPEPTEVPTPEPTEAPAPGPTEVPTPTPEPTGTPGVPPPVTGDTTVILPWLALLVLCVILLAYVVIKYF